MISITLLHIIMMILMVMMMRRRRVLLLVIFTALLHYLTKIFDDDHLKDNPPTVSLVGVGDVCFFLTMRCFNDAMFSNS